MRCTALLLLQLALVVAVVVMFDAARYLASAADTTDRRGRKLHDPETEVFAEPEMLIFGSRTTDDGTQQQRMSTGHAMPAPFAKATQRRPVHMTRERHNENKLQRAQMLNDMSMDDSADADTTSSDQDRLELRQQRQRARIAAARSRTPTQRVSPSSKRNRNDANNSNAMDSDTPQSHQPNNHSNPYSAAVTNNRPSSKRKPTQTHASSSSTTTSTSTRAPHTNIFEHFQRNNPFNFFSPQFWYPTTTARPTSSSPSGQRSRSTATKRPPKKYQPAATPTTITSNKEEKLLARQKPKTATTTTTAAAAAAAAAAATPTNAAADGPFRITLPTLSLLGDAAAAAAPKPTDAATRPNTHTAKEKDKRAIVAALRERYVCPRESEVRFQLFPKICNVDKDCAVWQRDEICCDIFGAKSCVTGKPKPLEESSHAPILGVIPRKCPTRPLAELWWEVKECDTDMDCWPRICCPDGRRRYCRTSQPELEAAPVPVKRSFNYLTEYLECTAPPPPIFDLHPRACTSTLDCFPNVCCQEAGLRHCRPPKKSVLTLMANFLNVDFVKRLTQNIVIK